MWRNVVTAAVVTLAATAILSAQPTGHQMPDQPHTAQAASAETVAACIGAQQQASRIADQAQARIEAARQTNSPAEMRAALDDLQAALGRIRGTLAVCDALASVAALSAAHQGHPMGTVQQSPSVAPSTPAMPPGSPLPAPAGARPAPPAGAVDHSTMGHGTPGPATADTKTAPKATYQRKVYYFCSTKDRDEFLKDPAAYLKKRPRG